MNLRDAMLKAADQIESHPETFNFMSMLAPDPSCGTPGCALGWIGVYAGIAATQPLFLLSVCDAIGVLNTSEFYRRMDACCGDDFDWVDNPDLCARGLRTYADKYFPASA